MPKRTNDPHSKKQKIWQLFCSSTSLHGWNYISDTKSTVLRCFWLTIIVISFIWASDQISDSIISWQKYPTIMTIQNYSKSVRDIQFPTITICPEGWDNDRWGFVKALLNEFEYPCNPDEDKKCGNLMNEFDFFLNEMKGKFAAVLDDYASHGFSDELNFKHFQSEATVLMFVYSSILLRDFYDSYSSMTEMIVEAFIGNRSAYEAHLDLYWQHIWTDFNESQNQEFEETQVCLTNDSCPPTELIKYARKEMLHYFTLRSDDVSIGGLGTLMSIFASSVLNDKSLRDYEARFLLDSWLFELPFYAFDDPKGSFYFRNSSLGFNDLTEKFYEAIKKLITPFGPNLSDEISPLDIPAILQKTPDFMHRNKWSTLFHYSAFHMLNNTESTLIANETSRDGTGTRRNDNALRELAHKVFNENLIGKKLSSEKEVIIKIMLLSAPLAVEYDERRSLFNTLFGGTKQDEFPERAAPLPLFKPQYYGVDFNYDEVRLIISSLMKSWESKFKVDLNMLTLPTDNGVCAVANIDLEGVFHEDSNNMYLYDNVCKLNSPKNMEHKVSNISGAGRMNAVSFHIMGPRNLAIENVKGMKERKFQVSFNQNENFFSNLLSGIEIRPGIESVVTITPVQHVVSDTFRKLDFETRQCRFIHEVDEEHIGFFNFYTQKSCQYICSLRQMQQNFSCHPWDVPPLTTVNQDEIPLCDGVQAFKYQIEYEQYDPINDPSCHCPPDCEYVTFSAEKSNFNLIPDHECESYWEFKPGLTNTANVRRWRIPGNDISAMRSMLNGKWQNMSSEKFYETDLRSLIEYCQDRIPKEHAFLHVIIKEPTILQIAKNVRVSFAEKLGIAGGTIGLFTGLSLISVVEVAYWILSWISQVVRPVKRNKNRVCLKYNRKI